MNKNSLIEIKESIFTKIRNFFRNIIKKNNAEKNTLFTNNVSTGNSNIEKQVDNKKEFFNLYNKIKYGEISAFSVELEKLEKVCKMLEEECNLKEKRLKNTKEEIEIHKKNIMCYKNIV
jgi:hypothetical protein